MAFSSALPSCTPSPEGGRGLCWVSQGRETWPGLGNSVDWVGVGCSTPPKAVPDAQVGPDWLHWLSFQDCAPTPRQRSLTFVIIVGGQGDLGALCPVLYWLWAPHGPCGGERWLGPDSHREGHLWQPDPTLGGYCEHVVSSWGRLRSVQGLEGGWCLGHSREGLKARSR